MSKTKAGQAWQLFAVMDGDKLKGVVAKNPNRHEVIDVTADLRALMNPMQAFVEGIEAADSQEPKP